VRSSVRREPASTPTDLRGDAIQVARLHQRQSHRVVIAGLHTQARDLGEQLAVALRRQLDAALDLQRRHAVALHARRAHHRAGRLVFGKEDGGVAQPVERVGTAERPACAGRCRP